MTEVNGFIKLPRDLVRSDKWLAAPGKARLVLIDMWSFHNGKNNGGIAYSARRAMKAAGCSPNTAVKSLKFLQDAGWIEAVQRGGFEWKAGAKQGRATTWRIKLERGAK